MFEFENKNAEDIEVLEESIQVLEQDMEDLQKIITIREGMKRRHRELLKVREARLEKNADLTSPTKTMALLLEVGLVQKTLRNCEDDLLKVQKGMYATKHAFDKLNTTRSLTKPVVDTEDIN